MKTEDVLPPSTPGLRRIQPVGSRVTCNPAPTDTDRDWLVLVDAKGMQITEQDAARIVRAGNSLSKKKAECARSPR